MLRAKQTLFGLSILASSVALNGCATTYEEMNYTEEGVVYGTLAGAVTGAGIGFLIGGSLANALSAP